MNRKLLLMVLTCVGFLKLPAQVKDGYMEGYILRNNDTIPCQVQYDKMNFYSTVHVIINGDEITFYPNRTIDGFGFTNKGEQKHYGLISVEQQLGPRRVSTDVFVKKLVAGTINLYVHSYKVTTRRSTTVNGVEKSSSNTTQNFTTYYISKTDSSYKSLATPRVLESFRKKDLELYIKDNTELFERTGKRLTEKELIACLNEYNGLSN